MSIKVGYLNEDYTYDNLNNLNNILMLNSFNDSNVILLNNHDNTTDDVFLTFKNNYSTGLSSDTFVFKERDSNLMLINSNNILLNRQVYVDGNFQVNNKIYSSNNETKINSNVAINLLDTTDCFTVLSSNSKTLFKVCSNSSIEYNSDDIRMRTMDSAKTTLSIDKTNINISNNVYINNGTLYVNEISPVGNTININNATYSSTTIEKLVSTKSLTVVNSMSDNTDTVPFQIYKKHGYSDFIDIYSCNLNNSNQTIFVLNKDGFLGLGTSNPDACITIKKASNKILNYTGDVIGDTFQLTKRGNVGIGTTNPQGQLHIKRNDDLSQNDI